MAGRQWRGFYAAGLLAALIGCQTLPTLVQCPLPTTEQAARIEELVPAGTPREAAVATLKKAGIDGNFSDSNTVFYCDTWEQGDNERWHIHVQVLFDEQGKVYACRPDPLTITASGAEPGAVKISKPPREVASGPKPSVEDPFAE